MQPPLSEGLFLPITTPARAVVHRGSTAASNKCKVRDICIPVHSYLLVHCTYKDVCTYIHTYTFKLPCTFLGTYPYTADQNKEIPNYQVGRHYCLTRPSHNINLHCVNMYGVHCSVWRTETILACGLNTTDEMGKWRLDLQQVQASGTVKLRIISFTAKYTSTLSMLVSDVSRRTRV